ncbi:hypothetical protein LWI29_029813 [Acer saccharum]|uniref:Uncharacterized protein n=1 Tax=Acer saccharum TaxID=4024 RepID=A0AA39RJ82_ACESA|nr:hypothetical protein LWI29_029813 [Acer saccharum]
MDHIGLGGDHHAAALAPVTTADRIRDNRRNRRNNQHTRVAATDNNPYVFQPPRVQRPYHQPPQAPPPRGDD